MRPGSKSLAEAIKLLEALHAQVLNIPDGRQHQLEVYGVMVPRWAAAADTSEADAKQLVVDVVRRRAMQSVPVKDAIKVLRELLKEHEMSQSVRASDLEQSNG